MRTLVAICLGLPLWLMAAPAEPRVPRGRWQWRRAARTVLRAIHPRSSPVISMGMAGRISRWPTPTPG